MQQSIDSIPIVAFFVLFAVCGLLATECGFRLGRWWQNRTPEEREGPTAMFVSSLFALLAFLLAITMGMASDRFESRGGVVLGEANALGTAYLRAGYLPEPASGRVRHLFREYAPLRVVSNDLVEIRRGIARSIELQTEIWAITEELVRAAPDSPTIALFVESVNEVIDAHGRRVSAGLYRRVPAALLVLLILTSMVTLGMVGYNAGLTRRRSALTALVMIVVLGAVLTLLIDFDRPQHGFLTVSEQPLIDLCDQIGAPLGPRSP